ncbi:XamI family restriction endonuclease [Vallicoccus soli]|uniref:XamI family restriction endonuclease n=1 Tax=Vallicoccus soli TaxID=2339232 RepID=UPI001402225B|nr:XamI family restriction endonuclease [Vallicoccus soli]
MPPGFVDPPRWSAQELKAARDLSEARFAQQRRDEGPNAFADACADVRPRVEAALAASDDLRELTGKVFRDDPGAWQVFRYVCGPPISQEDLWTLVGGPRFKRVPPQYADATAAALRLVVDNVRFPWVADGRAPTEHERRAAVLATTVLHAAQMLGTSRRGEASLRQEDATAAALAAAGYQLEPSRRTLRVLDELPRGTYSRERKIAAGPGGAEKPAKCDVPVRLLDGRLFAVECKVSNGPKNSWKRVNREVGGKAETWRQAFGSQVLTAVVLAGVFDLSCLVTAQGSSPANGVVLLWEHDLTPLTDFVAAAAS